jgi:hypothetical protein
MLTFATLTISCGGARSISNEKIEGVAIEQTPNVSAGVLNENSAAPMPTTRVIFATATPVLESTQVVSSSAEAAINEDLSSSQAAEISVVGDNFIYAVQLGSPVTMPNWSHPDLGCNWLAVAGQLFGLDGAPDQGTVIEAGGTLLGEPILGLSVTGLIDLYGPGSYEMQLADQTVASQGKVWVQVKGASGEALSPIIFIDTFDDCAQNLIMLNFIQVEPYSEKDLLYLPLIIHTEP